MTEFPETLLRLADSWLAHRDLVAAVASFDLAETAGASADKCAGGRWIAHMLAGNFAAAWRESDTIRRLGTPDPHRFWTGEDLSNRSVIVRCLHGYGDAVQFLRYAPRLSALASHLVVEVPPAMKEIGSYFDGVEEVITWGTDAPAAPPRWDVQIEIMELPYVFRTEPDALPPAVGYLQLPEKVKSHAVRAMGESTLPRVGIVWAAGDWNAARSLPLELLGPLLEDSRCEFWSLQGGRAQDEWKRFLKYPHLRDAACCGEGIVPLAATIAHLDLVITVDTLAAHIAGAMGIPTWLLLQHAADWRWMVERSDSLWYPSLRLFRQPVEGEWGQVVVSLADELGRWLAAKRYPAVAA